MFICSQVSYAQAPANDLCANAASLPITGECNYITGSLYAATSTDVGTAPGCGVRRDVFYRFTVPNYMRQLSISVNITSASSPLTTTNTFIEVFNTNGCTLMNTQTGGCNNISVRRTYTLAPGTYTMRINTTANTTTSGSGAYNFRICATSNEICNNAVTLVNGTAVDGSLLGSIGGAPVPQGCATTSPDDDLWYKFVATNNFHTISLSNIGSNLSSAGPRLQLYTGTCGALASLGCANNTLYATGLTAGTTYYCRIYSQNAGQSGTAWGFSILLTTTQATVVTGGRLNEVFSQRILSAPSVLADPWEITYGPDNTLWVTEAKGYRVLRINPITGKKDTVLDVSQNSTFLPVADQTFNCTFNNGSGAQGGFAGLVLHPNFLNPTDEKNFVYVSYVHSKTSDNYFTNRVVRFTYNKVTNKLESPVSICDTLPGSNDHNSQRMIIAPVGNKQYLFYASGDMGAGQFGNKLRPIYAQHPESVEGKILRFNLEPDGDADVYDRWIPSGPTADERNPYSASLGRQSAVWSIGIRNNQGFAYDTLTKKLYGSSHGPYSDDEINVIERARNYGHPIVIGYAADGNVNGTTAGGAMFDGNTSYRHPSSCPVITDETAAALGIGPTYKDPFFSAYPNSPSYPNITSIWAASPLPGNGNWPSEGWSGLDIYNHTLIPGWKRSLVASSLKWGRLVRIKMDASGEGPFYKNVLKDTVSYFGSVNRFRDIAFAPNGKDIYVVMDRSTSTSGPSAAYPVVPACQGCLQRYTFLGYNDVAGQSSIDTLIMVADGTNNSCNTSTTITIDDMNKNYWVPITGPDGNVVAEIFTNGQVLGTVTASFYKNGNGVRVVNGSSYADRNITITPQFQPASAVKVRLYLTKKEYNALDANPLSGITTLSDVRIHKNSDPCQPAITSPTTIINPGLSAIHNDSAYVFQANITGFSSFYFASANLVLPINSLTFSGSYKNGVAYLKWETKNEINTDHFELERSLTGTEFVKIADITATGTQDSKTRYNYNDQDVLSHGVARLFYRLKIIDTDGSYSYSKVVVVDLPISMITSVSIFPNPADKQTTALIISPKEQQVRWQLIDVSGRVIISKDAVLRKGENRIVIDLANLRVGTYFLQVTGQSINVKEKIQKL